MGVVIAGGKHGSIALPNAFNGKQNWFISFWTNNGSGDCRLFADAGGGSGVEIGISPISAGHLDCYCSTGWVESDGNNYHTAATWLNPAVAADPNNPFPIRFYRNGVADGTPVGGFNNLNGSNAMYLGADSGGTGTGNYEMAELSIYDISALVGLTRAQLATALAAGDSPMDTGVAALMAYVRFRDNTDLTDLTGNGHDITWIGGTPANASTHPAVDDPPAVRKATQIITIFGG